MVILIDSLAMALSRSGSSSDSSPSASIDRILSIMYEAKIHPAGLKIRVKWVDHCNGYSQAYVTRGLDKNGGPSSNIRKLTSNSPVIG